MMAKSSTLPPLADRIKTSRYRRHAFAVGKTTSWARSEGGKARAENRDERRVDKCCKTSGCKCGKADGALDRMTSDSQLGLPLPTALVVWALR